MTQNDPAPRIWNALLSGVTILTIGFSVGQYVGKMQDGADIRLLRQQLLAHEAIPIHSGAAASSTLQVVANRIEKLEDLVQRIRDEGSPITDRRLTLIEQKLNMANGSR